MPKKYKNISQLAYHNYYKKNQFANQYFKHYRPKK